MKKLIFVLFLISVLLITFVGCDNNQTFITKEYSYDCTTVKSITVDVIDRIVEIRQSDDNQIHIDCYESEKEYYDVQIVNDGELSVKYSTDKNWNDFVGSKPSANYRKITVKIPNNALTELNVTTTIENIVVDNLSVQDGMSLNSNGGDVKINKVNVGKTISLIAKNGNIKGTIIGNWDTFAIDCTIKKGDCNLPANKQDGAKSLIVNCNNGDINLSFVEL